MADTSVPKIPQVDQNVQATQTAQTAQNDPVHQFLNMSSSTNPGEQTIPNQVNQNQTSSVHIGNGNSIPSPTNPVTNTNQITIANHLDVAQEVEKATNLGQDPKLDELYEPFWSMLADQFQLKDSQSKKRFLIVYFSENRQALMRFTQLTDSEFRTLLDQEWEVLPVRTRLESGRCICSQHIQNLYFLRNRRNSNSLTVGKNCLEEFKIPLYDQTISFLEKGNTDNMFRQCHSCGHKRVRANKSPKVRKCETCFKEKIPFMEFFCRPCSICGQRKVHQEDPQWRDKCTDCYELAKNNPQALAQMTEMRMCDECDQPKIPINEPQWKHVCTDCYRKGQMEIICQDCGKTFHTTKKNITRCIPCWKANKYGGGQRNQHNYAGSTGQAGQPGYSGRNYGPISIRGSQFENNQVQGYPTQNNQGYTTQPPPIPQMGQLNLNDYQQIDGNPNPGSQTGSQTGYNPYG